MNRMAVLSFCSRIAKLTVQRDSGSYGVDKPFEKFGVTLSLMAAAISQQGRAMNQDSKPEVLHHYKRRGTHGVDSPKAVIPFLMSTFSPSSVVDVGCGVGQWLHVFEQSGVRDLYGMDGPHVPKEQLYIAPERFHSTNLKAPAQLDRRFDMVLSLEVAEHLEAADAENFVTYLCSLGDVVVFSAALPLQGGENHFNEQLHEYWHEIFRNNGYEVYDAFRPRFWDNLDIDWWYRQNMYLFVKKSIGNPWGFPVGGYSAIHPEMFAFRLAAIEAANQTLSSKVTAWLKQLGRRILGRQ